MIEFLTADTSSTASLLVTFLPMVLILVFMYIILYLPQKKQDKKDAAMRASIEVGDTVITIGGVVGRVAAINDKDDTFVLETTSDRVKIRFRRSAISSVEKAGHRQHCKRYRQERCSCQEELIGSDCIT